MGSLHSDSNQQTKSFQLIISPVIDAINDTTLNYRFITKDLYGLMNWRMDFEW